MMSGVKKPSANRPITPAEVRSQIIDHLPAITTAWSLTGREVGFTTGFDSGLEIGGFALATTPDGRVLLAQVQELAIQERESMRVALNTEVLGAAAAAALESADVGLLNRIVAGSAHVLAEVTPAGLAPAPPQGFREGSIESAPSEAVRDLMVSGLGKSVGLHIGQTATARAPALLKASGFSRHTFMVGQSGSGKTYSLGVLLERLLVDTTIPMVILDPNSDYVHLGSLRRREEIGPRGGPAIGPKAYRELKARMAAAGDIVVATAESKDLPLRIHLSDLSIHEQALTLGLDPLVDRGEYGAFIDAVEELATLDRYGFDALVLELESHGDDSAAALVQRIRNLRVADWSVWAATDEPSLVAGVQGRRVVVLDTGSLEGARERSVVALAVLGLLRRREARTPILLVIDEAHNVLAPNADSALQKAVTDHGVWVAGEGRKYGVHMVVSTQRPQKIHRNVISQCDNLVLMRMNSVADIEELSTIFSHVPRSLIAEARSFAQGEMLVAGPIATPAIRVNVGERWCREGGADLPTTWADRR
jgi:uncharacterized protein